MTTASKYPNNHITNKFLKRSVSISNFHNISNNVNKEIETHIKHIKATLLNESNYQKYKQQQQRRRLQFHQHQPTKVSCSLLKDCDLLYKYLIHMEIYKTNFQRHCSNVIDIAIRFALLYVFCKMEVTPAFHRIIHLEELWLYKYPRTEDYVSGFTLFISVTLGPFIVTIIYLLFTKDKHDFYAATWTWTLCLVLNGLLTSLLKVIVGRPRPDFYFRCFPDGILRLANHTNNMMLPYLNCTGNVDDINEGYKSFPSGHSSFAFAAYSFITFYIGAKLHAFNRQGYGQSWRLCISLAPIILAIVVAVSRTCDYHHHWQDVVVGSIIGLSTSYTSYRQYYPSIFSMNCHRTIRKKLIGPATSNLYQYRHLSTDEQESEYLNDTNGSTLKNDEANEFMKSNDTEQKSEKCF